jgi:N-dimethylarginine dimethylaminohydrolase
MDHRKSKSDASSAASAASPVKAPSKTARKESASIGKEKRAIGVYNEWGRLREAVIGVQDDTVEIDFIPAMEWLPESGIEACKKYGGKKTKDAFPDIPAILKKQLDGHAKALEDHGVVVHRTTPMRYAEERNFLSDIQRGNMLFGGADFFRVIGHNVILLNSFRYPFRRKQVWVVRPLLEKLIKDANVRYIATPPPSPHYVEDELYLENGDIMIDGFNVYVGISGKASSEKGAAWLGQFLGPDYRVHIVRLAADRFHLDWVLTLNRPGLLTYCPAAIVGDLPEPLRTWDKIVVKPDESAGANNLSIDQNTIVIAEQYERIAKEYRKRGMKVITIPLDMTITYGSGSRCLTAVLSRDP